MKKSLWATASVIVLAYTTPVFTDDTDKVVNATGNMFMDSINRTGFFEWISGGVGYTDKTLNWDITAFSNLSETKDTVTYLQTSYNRQKSVNRLNLGLGYRKRIDTTATPLIVGVNAFFDSKDGTKNILAFKASDNFQRFSVGAELKTARFDMAANLYRRIGNTIIDDKKVLQGWDITAKGNIPNYEQVSVGVGTYRFDGVEDTVVRGNKLIAEFTPNAVVTVRGTYDKPNGESAQTDISVDFKLAFDKSIQDQLKSAPVSGTDAVWHKRYDKVERHYDIKTAEAQSTPTLGTAISSADLATNNISSGDGTTEQSAYALQNSQNYEILNFAGTIDSTDTIEVTVAKVSGDGVKGTDFQLYASDGTTVIALADVTADSKFEDKAGGREATLQFTFSADGFKDRVVFVKTNSTFTGTLTMADLVLPYASGTVTVSTADILGKLTVSGSQTQKSDWTIKSLTDTDSHANLTVNGKTLTVSGTIGSPTTVTAVFEHPEYADQTKTFELSTGAGTLGGTPTGLSGKWGKTFAVDYKLKTSDTVGDVTVSFDTGADFSFKILPRTDGSKGGKTATTAGIIDTSKTAINASTGAINGAALTKSGTLLVEIVRAAKGGLPELTVYENITVNKQVLGTDVTTIPTISLNSGDNKWKTGNSKFDLKYTNLPGGLAANAFSWAVAKKTGAAPSGTVRIDNDGKISGATSAGTVVITLTAKGDKYSGSLTLADFAIAKQTTTDTLTMADLVISYSDGDGNKVVSTAEILGQLSVSGGQTQKSQWTLVSVADTDNNGDLAVTGGGKTLTISDEIKTKTTVTATLSHPAYENKTATFELSTEPSKISTTAPSGSGKWGKSYTTNYNLRRTVGSVTFTNADYTFSIVPTGDDGSGKTPTTSGIVASGQNAISNPRTGAIDASKLTKSGTLLIKIVRAAKGAGAARVDAVTEYQNFTVSKQDSTDHTGFTVSAGAIAWATASTAVTYTLTNGPAGIGTATYALTASGTTAGTTTGASAITVASSDGKIGKTTKSGVVKVKVTYAANDKYETMTRDVDVTINKQAGTGALTMGNLVIPYGGSGDTKVSTATITGKLGVPSAGGLGAKSDWTLKSLADTDSNSNLTETDSGKTLTISGAITTSTTVTATFESDKYTDKSATFELSTGAGAMSTGDTRTGLSGKWGIGFSTAADYKLKLSDSVGDTSVTFTKGATSTPGDYTFSIVTGNVPSDAPSGAKATTTSILDTSKTAINANTGAINAAALVKSGDLLVKIVRKAKSGLPALTDYENITVTKQDSSDHTGFTVSAGAITWNANSQTVSYTENASKPAGIGTATYALIDTGTTAGTVAGGKGTIEVTLSNGKIAKTVRSGVVKVRITYAANDKYAQMTRDVDVPINKQTAAGTLSMANLVVPYTSGNKTVSTADILGQMTAPTGTQKADWTLKSLADTDSNGNLAIDVGGKSITISGTIPAGTTVTAVFESVKYNDKTGITFELSTSKGTMSSGTRTGLSGKWGTGFTSSTNVDYKLKLSDTVGDTTVTFTKGTTTNAGDYTFTILPTSAGSKGGKDATTSGIALTGAINANTGAIDGTKLTKSGKLLVKIVRKAKGGLSEITDYENIIVTKQVLTPAVASSVKSVQAPGALHTMTQAGTASDPFATASRQLYPISKLISVPSGLGTPTVTVTWTESGNLQTQGLGVSVINDRLGAPDFNIMNSNKGTTIPNALQRNIFDFFNRDATNTVQLIFTFTNPDTDKYDLTQSVINVYIKGNAG